MKKTTCALPAGGSGSLVDVSSAGGRCCTETPTKKVCVCKKSVFLSLRGYQMQSNVFPPLIKAKEWHKLYYGHSVIK